VLSSLASGKPPCAKGQSLVVCLQRPAVCRSSTGLWCNGGTCLGSACSVDVLLDETTVATLGAMPVCAWKDRRTVTVVFGTGEAMIIQYKGSTGACFMWFVHTIG